MRVRRDMEDRGINHDTPVPLLLPLVLLSLGPLLPSCAEPGPHAQPRPQPVSKALRHDLQSLEQLLLRVLVLVEGDRQLLHLSAQPLLEMCLALQCG